MRMISSRRRRRSVMSNLLPPLALGAAGSILGAVVLWLARAVFRWAGREINKGVETHKTKSQLYLQGSPDERFEMMSAEIAGLIMSSLIILSLQIVTVSLFIVANVNANFRGEPIGLGMGTGVFLQGFGFAFFVRAMIHYRSILNFRLVRMEEEIKMRTATA